MEKWSLNNGLGREMATTFYPLVFKCFGGCVRGGCDGKTSPCSLLQNTLVPTMQGFTNAFPHIGLFVGPEVRVQGESTTADGKTLTASIVPLWVGLNTFPILFKTLQGTRLSILMTIDTYIQSLKQMIEGKTHISFVSQLLLYGGKILDENYHLLYYSIRKDAIIILSAHIRRVETKRGTPSSFKPSFKYMLHKKSRPQPTGSLVE